MNTPQHPLKGTEGIFDRGLAILRDPEFAVDGPPLVRRFPLNPPVSMATLHRCSQKQSGDNWTELYLPSDVHHAHPNPQF